MLMLLPRPTRLLHRAASDSCPLQAPRTCSNRRHLLLLFLWVSRPPNLLASVAVLRPTMVLVLFQRLFSTPPCCHWLCVMVRVLGLLPRRIARIPTGPTGLLWRRLSR